MTISRENCVTSLFIVTLFVKVHWATRTTRNLLTVGETFLKLLCIKTGQSFNYFIAKKVKAQRNFSKHHKNEHEK